MWTPAIEQRAAAMRERMQSRAAQQGISGDSYIAARITEAQRADGLRKARAVQKQRGDLHRDDVREVVVEVRRRGTLGRPKGSRTLPGQQHYPACPHCNGATPAGTIRAGMTNGIQRYRCKWCRKTYSGPTIQFKLEPCDYVMICYHCGSTKTTRQGRGYNDARSGRMALCNGCGRKFVQGGLKDYTKYHILLEKRIAELNLPDDVEAEVLQMAAEDVLTGKGYCWSVVLRTKAAWRNVRGEYGQRGSDHPVFRAQQGQPPLEQW